jgi:hypothetical protein
VVATIPPERKSLQTGSKIMNTRAITILAATKLLPLRLLLLLALPAVAQAQLDFTTNDDQITITGYNIAGGLNVTIPSTINGYPVTSIGVYAFFDCGSLTGAYF